MSLYLIKERVENVFTSELTARVTPSTGVPFYAGGRDTTNPALQGVCKCDKASELTPESGVYEAELAIILVRNMDDPSTNPSQTRDQQQSALCKAVETAINQIPRPGYDADIGIVLNGWVIEDVKDASDEQDFADILFLKVGCSLLEKDGQAAPHDGDVVMP